MSGSAVKSADLSAAELSISPNESLKRKLSVVVKCQVERSKARRNKLWYPSGYTATSRLLRPSMCYHFGKSTMTPIRVEEFGHGGAETGYNHEPAPKCSIF